MSSVLYLIHFFRLASILHLFIVSQEKWKLETVIVPIVSMDFYEIQSNMGF